MQCIDRPSKHGAETYNFMLSSNPEAFSQNKPSQVGKYVPWQKKEKGEIKLQGAEGRR
jgi:hypothetical protein